MNSINKQILKLAIPSVLANITTPLLGLVDTAIVGHLGNALYIAAIGVGSVMFNMMYWLFDFLRAGTSGLSAQAFGASDNRESTLVLLRSVALATLLGLLMILLQKPLFLLLTGILDSAETTSTVSQYFFILIYGAPAVLCNYVLSGWFLGQQQSAKLFWISLIINVVNICGSLTFVYIFGLGIRGIALGSLIAQWSGLLYGSISLRGHGLVRTRLAEFFQFERMRGFLKVNFDVMVRTACIIAVTVWFTRVGAGEGTLILAVNTLLMQFFYIFSYLMDGFAFAGEALVGKFSGGNRPVELRSCVRYLLLWGVGSAFLFSLLYFVGGKLLLGLLCDDPAVIAGSQEFYLWTVAIPVAGFAAFVWDGIFIGAMMTGKMLLATFVATVIFFVVYLAGFPTLANHGLWLAFIAYLATRGIMQTILYRPK